MAFCVPEDFLSLVLRLETRTPHRINALRVMRMLCAKVGLCELLALRIKLNSCIEATKLLVLLTYGQVAHHHDCDEVIELKTKVFLHFVVLLHVWLAVLILNFLAEFIAS